jgi:hypothetical protein
MRIFRSNPEFPEHPDVFIRSDILISVDSRILKDIHRLEFPSIFLMLFASHSR